MTEQDDTAELMVLITQLDQLREMAEELIRQRQFRNQRRKPSVATWRGMRQPLTDR